MGMTMLIEAGQFTAERGGCQARAEKNCGRPGCRGGRNGGRFDGPPPMCGQGVRSEGWPPRHGLPVGEIICHPSSRWR